MSDLIDYQRRAMLRSTSALTALAIATMSEKVMAATASDMTVQQRPMLGNSLGLIRQIETDELNIGYADIGTTEGPVVILLHGWPHDIHSFVDVAPILAAEGYRVIVPYLRGYGSTRIRSADTLRNGQQVMPHAAGTIGTVALQETLMNL